MQVSALLRTYSHFNSKKKTHNVHSISQLSPFFDESLISVVHKIGAFVSMSTTCRPAAAAHAVSSLVEAAGPASANALDEFTYPPIEISVSVISHFKPCVVTLVAGPMTGRSPHVKPSY